jgi:hypothetical protein
MCCSNWRDTSEPRDMPSSSRTAWVRIGGKLSGRPAMAAAPTAIMAPEIRPPGRFAHKNNAPPALPITRVSSTLRVLARVGMASAIEAGIRLTLPYGKSQPALQMRQSGAALRLRLRFTELPPCRNSGAKLSVLMAKRRSGLAHRPPHFQGRTARALRLRLGGGVLAGLLA